MENATKALEMAGSVLIGVLILGCIAYAYSQIAETKKGEQTATRIEQATDFNKDYEAYNRDDLYGSDLFSLANKIEDYNKKEAEQKSYGKIDIEVNVTTEIKDAQCFNKKKYTANEINEAYNNLSAKINQANKVFFEQKVSYWANFGTSTRLENQLLQKLR